MLVGLIALTGTLLAVFAMLVARLVTALPPTVRSGFDSPAGRHLITALVVMGGGALVADELVSSARTLVQADLYRRYEEYLLARVMTATLGASRLELFEDPAQAGKVQRTAMLAESEPGDLVDGMAAKWTAKVQGLAGAVLVATVWPIAAVVLAAVWILVGRRLQADYQRLDPSGSAAHHRASYFWNLGLMPSWAKEVRIFGLVGWIVDQFTHQWDLVMAELAAARRIDRRTRTGLLIMVIAANTVIVLWAARAAIDGSLGVGAVTVLVQGLFGVVLLADQTGDLLIGWGASHVPQVMDVERAAAALESRPQGTITADGLPHHDITLERLCFCYPGRDVPVYDGLNLRIDAGRSLAIVGLNGAGKTTLAKLIAGLELPQQGRITVDGTLVSQASSADLRRPSAGTRWTNQQLLFHMLFGYLIVRALLGLVRVFGRLPGGVKCRFAEVLNAGTRPFHAVNYLGSCGGGLVFRGHRLAAAMDRVIASHHRRLDAETEDALERRMQFPIRWDPFFRDEMNLAEVYRYGTEHFDFHATQLTLEWPQL